jgi:DNA-binding response OmpR family regulator
MRIALLEDDPAQRDLMRSVIKAMGHECQAYDSGREFLRILRRESFDMLVLDWGVPDMSGLEVLKWVRCHEETRVPVLFVTNHADERDMIQLLDAGADDYMSKPFTIPAMLSRIRALLRRAYPPARKEGKTVFGPYEFDVSLRTVLTDGKLIELTLKEFQLAHLLLSNEGRLLSRQHMIESVWNNGAGVNSRTLDTHISQVRHKLNLRPENGYRLMSVYSMGYRLESTARVNLVEAHSQEPAIA